VDSSATLTTTWQRFTFTFAVGATATELSVALTNVTTGTAGADDYFEITGVQLELGTTATTFSRAGGTIQGELAACQRYYSKSYNIETAPATSSTIGAVAMKTAYTSSYQNMPPVYFKTTMRVSPTITLYSTGGTSGKIRSGAGGGTDVNGASQYIGSNGFVAYVDNVSITSDIELRFQFAAEAEL
jgi:hypothetical protein